MKKKLLLIVSIMSLFLHGCNPVLSMKDAANELKEKVVKEFKSASKSSSEKLDKKIATINTAISEKDEEVIYNQMSEYVKKDENKLRLQLKNVVNYIPGTITKSMDRSWGTIVHNVKCDKFYDGRANVFIYRLEYTAIDDQNQKYYIRIEYMKENEVRPTQAGIDYISIFGENDDDNVVEAGEILY